MVVISGHVVNGPSQRRQAESGGIEVILMQTEVADLNGSFNIGRESGHLTGEAVERPVHIADKRDHCLEPAFCGRADCWWSMTR